MVSNWLWRVTHSCATDFSDATNAFASVFRHALHRVLCSASVWNQQFLRQRLEGAAFILQ